MKIIMQTVNRDRSQRQITLSGNLNEYASERRSGKWDWGVDLGKKVQGPYKLSGKE